METDLLTKYLTDFVNSRHAQRLCRPYHADAMGALGYLFLWFAKRLRQPIRCPSAWVRRNADGLLRNYLRKEYRQLRQSEES